MIDDGRYRICNQHSETVGHLVAGYTKISKQQISNQTQQRDFEFHLQKTTTARRSDLILELKIEKKIWICDMACPQQNNIGAKRAEKMTKCRQVAFETRERRPGYKVYVVPVVVRAFGGGIKALRFDLKKIFENNELLDEIIAMMQRTVLMDSESIIRRVISGLI